MRLIGLMGKSKSGKNAIGDMLVAHNPKGTTLAFADKLKEVVIDLFGLSHDDCYTEEGKAKSTALPVFKCPACSSINCALVAPNQVLCSNCTGVGEAEAFKSFWTPRMILQFVGTEGIRRVDQDAWVKHAICRAESLLLTRTFVAITDCRFKSEMDAIQKAGGEVWRIRRPSTDNHTQGIAGHASETEMDQIPDTMFQCVIHNDATLDVLRAKSIEQLTRFTAARL